MNFLKLYLALRRHIKLSSRRHPMFEQNQVAKVFVYLGMGFTILYLIVIGTMLGWGTRGGDFTLLFTFMPFLLTLDFFMRFGMQQTPAMLIKPYLLMPLNRMRIIDCFLVSNLLSGGNFIWMALFVPYVFICVCGGLTLLGGLALLALLHLLILVNSQWYLLVRTLVNHKIWWWALPIVVYLAMYGYAFIDIDKWLDTLFSFSEDYWFTWTGAAVTLLVGIVLFLINRRLQSHFVIEEVSRHESTKLRHVSQFSFLNHFGQVGEYLKLEVKSTLRNKTVKQRFIQGIVIITMLSLLLSLTDVYDGRFSTNIWCLYCFVFFGAVNLVKIMGPEGNYIDLLMVHKENIYTLLKAKYFFYCAILILPTLLLIPTVVSGRYSILMILAYLFLTSGPEYCLLFQLAAYNKQTLPLNDKITGKGNFENTLQLVVELIVFFVPVALALLVTGIFGDTIGYTILIIIGLLFTATHSLWLKNIYSRMMKRRYDNLDGFHTTR